ncbi:YjdF family protein [Plantibacter sp. Mn2098]|uniref:YjdF family protein n=1 Tax=Plantibacter sp. Mn2098 TaxID=3395266 RepID=UPI003BDA803A
MGTETTFTVFFDGSFWVGVLEVLEHGEIRAAKVIFGAEPTSAELWMFTRTDGNRLIDAVNRAPRVSHEERARDRLPRNPKRLAREAVPRQCDSRTTRSQEALAAALAEKRKVRSDASRERRRAESEKRRAVRVAKRKAKHRGK